MPLVFVHGVANRPGPEQRAEIKQRDALFKSLVFGGKDVAILNPDWGSGAVHFSANLPWLPKPEISQAFGADFTGPAEAAAQPVGLGRIARQDGVQAVDLAVLAALERAVVMAPDNDPGAAAAPELISLAAAAANYVGPRAGDPKPKGIPELDAPDDTAFAEALNAELAAGNTDLQAFGIGDTIRDALGALGGWIGNRASDVALRRYREGVSLKSAFFLGDVFVYLRGRDTAGPTGTSTRLFDPIIDALVTAARAPRATETEPFVVVGHSLGGVLLYDLLTDPVSVAKLEEAVPGFKIDAWLTVGSQPGFFADLQLFANKPTVGNKLKAPPSVARWLNVYDFTDTLSFLCAPFFEGVEDFGYDTQIDLFQAHSAYFKRPSFYKRLEIRLKEMGHL